VLGVRARILPGVSRTCDTIAWRCCISNLPFSEGGSVFPDPRFIAAIVDRVTFNAHIIETGTQSYGLRTSKTTIHHKRAI
jgi:hypothetical protein